MKKVNVVVEKNDVMVIEIKALGRPVNPNSVRQIRLAELAAKKAAGELKKGRPVVEDSARQKRLAELEAKRANGELRRGRPSNAESARQKRLAELAAKAAANGGTVKRGRPAKAKADEAVEIAAAEGNIE
jgi:hypothetical protein